ncbi:hypothetical protein B0H19DRAFT_1059883 [Mycena capillaripes]|nr:hypothetical protein B0H19DRAFT_1059883 [Mycena capillaripes]
MDAGDPEFLSARSRSSGPAVVAPVPAPSCILPKVRRLTPFSILAADTLGGMCCGPLNSLGAVHAPSHSHSPDAARGSPASLKPPVDAYNCLRPGASFSSLSCVTSLTFARGAEGVGGPELGLDAPPRPVLLPHPSPALAWPRPFELHVRMHHERPDAIAIAIARRSPALSLSISIPTPRLQARSARVWIVSVTPVFEDAAYTSRPADADETSSSRHSSLWPCSTTSRYLGTETTAREGDGDEAPSCCDDAGGADGDAERPTRLSHHPPPPTPTAPSDSPPHTACATRFPAEAFAPSVHACGVVPGGMQGERREGYQGKAGCTRVVYGRTPLHTIKSARAKRP